MVTNAEAIGDKADEVADGYGADANMERLQNAPGAKQVNETVDAAQQTFDSGYKAVGDIAKGDLSALGDDATATIQTANEYVQSASETIASIVADPLGWLIQNGLDFLISWVKPLEDILELVTGDPDALTTGADAFNQLGADIEQLTKDTEQLLSEGLAEWSGPAAEAAGKKFAEFRDGMSGTAGASGNIASLLASSAMVMEMARDVILGIISDFVEWLIITWVAAQAAAGPTFGASEVAAVEATEVNAGINTARGTREVSRVEKVIDKIKEMIDKIKQFLQKARKFFDDPGKGIRDAGKATKEWGKNAPKKLQEGLVNDTLGTGRADAIRSGSTTANQGAKEAIQEGWTGTLKESATEQFNDNVRDRFVATDEVEQKDTETGETAVDENGDPDTNTHVDSVGTAEKAKENYGETIGRRDQHGDPNMTDSEIDRRLNF